MASYGSRLATSCKECRRLKLKCDKKVPCSSCVRRGCAPICPTGHMVAKGSRFILANTEELHDKIDTLIARIHALESALEGSHALQTSEAHPLLRKELRLLATPVSSVVPGPEQVPKEEELVDSIGTLTLDGHGSRYFGSTGAFASLWNDGEGSGGPGGIKIKYKEGLSRALAGLPFELVHMAHAFPIRIPANENVQQLSTWILQNCLPSYEEAWSLFENYWEHYAWHTTPFTRSTFVEQILSPFYHRVRDDGDKPLGHRLALLFMVFAIGQFVDLTRPFDVTNGQRYYMLARASLCLEPVFENPTVTALQAMYLIGVYLMMSRGAHTPEHGWILSGINIKLALALGLQHDARKFDLPPVEVEARAQVMVSVLSYETFQALIVGRQPSCTFANFDWVIPQPPETPSKMPLISLKWSPLFIRDCVGVVMEAARETKYSAILKIDAKIRQYPALHPSELPSQISGETPSIGLLIQRNIVHVLKEVALLFLHRRFFALALTRSPNDPLKSPFAPSVLACYRSSVAFLTKLRSLHDISRELVQRLWFIWPNVFVATIILGSIVARSPGCSLASSALLELEMVCQLWETASECVCGPKVLATVSKLKQKAFIAFSQNKASDAHFKGPSPGVEVDDEIAALGGRGPQVISSSAKVSGSSTHSPPETSSTTRNTSSPPSEPADDPALFSFSDFAGVSAYSTMHTQESTTVNLPDQFPDIPTDMWTTEFDDMFQGFDTSATTQPPGVGPSVLEELGLSGGWQPVMDDLGL